MLLKVHWIYFLNFLSHSVFPFFHFLQLFFIFTLIPFYPLRDDDDDDDDDEVLENHPYFLSFSIGTPKACRRPHYCWPLCHHHHY